MKKLALDIDDVIACMQPAFYKVCGVAEKKMDYWDDPEAIAMYMHHFKDVMHEEKFWLDLTPLITPESISGIVKKSLKCYITSSPKEMIGIRKHWLDFYGFPDVPVYYSENKLQSMIYHNIDVLVDDKVSTVETINNSDTKLALQFKPPYMAGEYHDKEFIITHLSEVERWLL